MPRIKSLMDDFIVSQFCSFEKIPIEVPMGDMPIYV